MQTTAYILLALGVLINGMSVLGLIRFPDVYTRIHAATKTTTFGSFLIVMAVVLDSIVLKDDAGFMIIVHSVLALLVIIFTNPISAHAISRAALIAGIKPYGAKVNDYEDRDRRGGNI